MSNSELPSDIQKMLEQNPEFLAAEARNEYAHLLQKFVNARPKHPNGKEGAFLEFRYKYAVYVTEDGDEFFPGADQLHTLK